MGKDSANDAPVGKEGPQPPDSRSSDSSRSAPHPEATQPRSDDAVPVASSINSAATSASGVTPAPVTAQRAPEAAAVAGSSPASGTRWTPADLVGRLFEPKKLVKDVVDWFVVLYDKHPRAFGLTAIGILVAAAAIRVVGIDLLAFVPKLTGIPSSVEQLPVMRDITWVGDLSHSRDCVAKGKELGRKYVFLNVTQWVQYEVSPAKDRHLVEQRIVYTILPLVDIADTDQVFAEDYQGSGATDRWYGPRRETPMPGTNRYQVSFAGKKGVPLMIVTGARMSYAQPFANYRQAFRQKVALAANHDFWVYENTEDVICSITQVIDSKTLLLVPLGRGGHRIGNDGAHLEGEVMTQPPAVPANPNSALSMTWTLVLPGDDVGLAFAW